MQREEVGVQCDTAGCRLYLQGNLHSPLVAELAAKLDAVNREIIVRGFDAEI